MQWYKIQSKRVITFNTSGFFFFLLQGLLRMLIIYSIRLGILYSTLQTENISDILRANTVSQRTSKDKKKNPISFHPVFTQLAQSFRSNSQWQWWHNSTFCTISERRDGLHFALTRPRQPGASAYLCRSGDNQDPSMQQHELPPATTCAQHLLSPWLECLHLLNISSCFHILTKVTSKIISLNVRFRFSTPNFSLPLNVWFS